MTEDNEILFEDDAKYSSLVEERKAWQEKFNKNHPCWYRLRPHKGQD